MYKHSLQVLKGQCIIYLAYDIGREVRMELAEKRIQQQVQRPQIASDRRQPKYFGYDPRPLRFARKAQPVTIGTYETDAEVECTVWDFGALTLAFRIQIPPETPFHNLVELSATLDETDRIEVDATSLVEQIAAELGDSVRDRHVVDTVEDFIVFRISQLKDRLSGSALCATEQASLAQIVRCERVLLAENIVNETLKYRVSYKALSQTREDADLTVIGWNAAIVYGQDEETAGDDVCAVLEFVLTYLLEMRLLDEKLDDYLDEAYNVSLRRGKWFRADFSRVGMIQIDAAMLFEAVHNALKLIGDQFLAEVQRAAAARFGFDELDTTIRRKLNTLQEIYEKLADRQAHFRAELLEVIIIVLILVEILLH